MMGLQWSLRRAMATERPLRFAAFRNRAVAIREELTVVGFIAAISVVSPICHWLGDRCAWLTTQPQITVVARDRGGA